MVNGSTLAVKVNISTEDPNYDFTSFYPYPDPPVDEVIVELISPTVPEDVVEVVGLNELPGFWERFIDALKSRWLG